ncbi:MAG: VWA domain-containing protein [Lautropia sp.]
MTAARIADNVVHFARVLRAAGLPVGTDRIGGAIAALEIVGLRRREDVHAALASVLLDRHEQRPVFDAAFDAFWRDPKLLERLMYMALPKVDGRGLREEDAARPRRVDEALRAGAAPPAPQRPGRPDEDEASFDAAMTFSDRERLQQADFASMSAEEFAAARRIAREIELPLRPIPTRRHAPSARGRIDMRRSLRQALRTPDSIALARSAARRKPPPLVILLDISGSMETYTRMFLNFAHGLMQRMPRVHVLVFGTRLTDITRCLRHRDADVALVRADRAVSDWRGGTRIASSLAQFNKRWARRLLTGNAAMMLVSDGLDRDDNGELDREAARLARFSHQFVWLNPLLRFEGFEPRAAGIRAILPHVDRFLPMHNLQSLADLARALGAPGGTPAITPTRG